MKNPTRRSMEPSYLKTFVEVVRSGSFTKTAENLCLSQSSVTRRIQHMEEQYECCLLDRSGPQLKPTEKGRRLLTKALKIIEIEKDLTLDLKNSEGSSLSFISTQNFGACYLPHIMRQFVAGESSRLNFNFSQEMPEAIRNDLRCGAFEVAVIEHCAGFDLSEFHTVALPTDELVFAAANSLPLGSPHPELEELFQYPLLSSGSGCCTRVIFEKNLAARGYTKDDFRQVSVISNWDILRRSLISGSGVAFLPLIQIRDLVESGQLKTYRFDKMIHYRSRSLIRPSSDMERSPAYRFAEQIERFFDHKHHHS